MKKVFIDTSAYFALVNPVDIHNPRAITASDMYSQQEYQLFTSQRNLEELLTIGAMKFDKEKTLDFVKKILTQTPTVVLNQDFFDETWNIFEKVSKKDISWIDCYSIALMKNNDIPEIFTFDRHFDSLIDQFLR